MKTLKTPPPCHRNGNAPHGGFSLIEVTIALGIIAFALVAVVGLLPAGLNSQKQGSQQGRAAQVLNQVARSVQGVRMDTNATLRFLPPLSTVGVSAGTTANLGFYRDGTFAVSSPSDPNQMGAVHIALDNSLSIPNTIRAVISVAWPGAAQRETSGWTKNEGSMDTVLFINLPQ